MKKEAWEKFMNTGSVNDYLTYKRKQRRYLNEMGTEVIIKDSKRDKDGNSRRDCAKRK